MKRRLMRSNSAAGRAYAASVERINAVIQKPRTFYIPDSSMTATPTRDCVKKIATRSSAACGHRARHWPALAASVGD